MNAGSEVDYPPYCFVNEEGKADDFSVQLLDMVAKEMGYQTEYQTGIWHNLKKTGKAAFMSGSITFLQKRPKPQNPRKRNRPYPIRK